jgi:hydroxyacylglutathione hydrolase
MPQNFDIPDSQPQTEAAQYFQRSFPVGPLGCNCTILGVPATGEAIVVDPGGDVDLILDILQEAGLTKVVSILHTHAHFDHFLASGDLHERTGAPLCLHKEDEPLWQILEKQCALYNIPYRPVPEPQHWLSHQEEVSAGSLQGEALWTPGHTPGSMSFYFPQIKLVLSGDTLFRRSVGRTDLWGGNSATLIQSIRTQLFTLDETAVVIPGHGRSTTIGEELRLNPYAAT